MRLPIDFGRRSDRNGARGATENGLLKVGRDTAGPGAGGGCNVCATEPGDDIGGPFRVDDFLEIVSTVNITRLSERATHHLLAKEIKSLERAHCLCAGLNILKDNMGLTSHFLRLHSHDVENGTVGAEQRVKGRTQIMLIELVW